MPKATAQRSLKFFDLLGVLAVVAWTLLVFADLGALRMIGNAPALARSETSSGEGFREGIAWYGLYLQGDRIGFSRIEQRRSGDTLEVGSRMVMKPTILGTTVDMSIRLDLRLDTEMRPLRFDLRADTGISTLEARGEATNGLLDLEFSAGSISERTTIDIGNATIDLGLQPAFMRSHPEPGDRASIEVFDPVALSTRQVEIEYLGIETITVLGEEISSHHLRQYAGDLKLDSWVSDNGEILREELPLGIVAIRETEAAATYGFGRGAPVPTPEMIQPDDLRHLIDGFRHSIQGTPQGENEE